jgi:HEAT repeat protein
MSRPSRPGVKAQEKLAEIAALSRLPAEQAAGPLIALLEFPHGSVIEAAAKALGDLEEVPAGESLITAYEWADGAKGRDPGCRARRAVVRALGKLDYRPGVPIVRQALYTVQIEPVGFGLEDTGLGLRATAALALAQLDRFNAVHDLALLLFDTEPNLPVPATEHLFNKAPTRIAAVQALASLGETAVAPLLAVKVRYPVREVPEVIAACLEGLAALDPPNLADLMLPYLQGADAYLASTAAAALAQQKGADALALLEEAVEAFPADGRVALVLAITGIRSDETGRVLLRFTSDRDPQVRQAAVDGLALYPSDDVRATLRLLASSDPNDRVRSAAKSALDRIE